MERNHAIRITHVYASISRVMQLWSDVCDKLVCYEHDDDGANNVHCHVHIEGARVSKKRIQQIANSVIPMTRAVEGKRASSLMSFRSKEYDFNIAGYAYLTKGKYDPKYQHGFTDDQVNSWKSSWVIPTDYHKRCEYEELFNAFNLTIPIKPDPTQAEIDYWLTLTDKTPQPSNKYTFEEIKRLAHKFVWAKLNNTWKPTYFKYKNCCLITYCWKNKIFIPEDWKV